MKFVLAIAAFLTVCLVMLGLYWASGIPFTRDPDHAAFAALSLYIAAAAGVFVYVTGKQT